MNGLATWWGWLAGAASTLAFLAVVLYSLMAWKRWRIKHLLTTAFDPYAVLRPVRSARGQIEDLLITEVNPAASIWFGRDSEHLVGKRLLEVDPEFGVAGLFDVLREATSGTGGVATRSFAYRRSQTDTRWLDIRAIGLGGLVGITWRDMTDMHAVHAKLAAAEEQVRLLAGSARIDELTSLFNRREALKQINALNHRSGGDVAVLWCDVDGFKLVNDTHGHATGDAVLKHLANTLQTSLRSSDDLAARMGGDEVMVVLRGVRSLEDAREVAEKLRRAAAEPIPTNEGPVLITLSIGVTLARPSESADAVIARADNAMYQAKESGGNRVVAIEEEETALPARIDALLP